MRRYTVSVAFHSEELQAPVWSSAWCALHSASQSEGQRGQDGIQKPVPIIFVRHLSKKQAQASYVVKVLFQRQNKCSENRTRASCTKRSRDWKKNGRKSSCVASDFYQNISDKIRTELPRCDIPSRSSYSCLCAVVSMNRTANKTRQNTTSHCSTGELSFSHV